MVIKRELGGFHFYEGMRESRHDPVDRAGGASA